ncbi:METRN protein, partial [Lanius ludovicianus]|nr:METRN protein [Lanius ludovicianus]
SGLSQEAGSVEQLSLHCAEGSLEWLYPTGALRLRLAPRLPPTSAAVKGGSAPHVTACIKPTGTFRGAQLYLEREGVLELLLPEAPRPRARCFSWLPQEKVALFLQATPHPDISRRIAAFRYELRGDWLARPALPAASLSAEVRCGVKPGPGTFLFTGWLHFGEAWLSCAPRYRDFQRIYEGAQRTRQNPCEFPVD